MEITLSTGKKVSLRSGLTGAHQLAASKLLSGLSKSSGGLNAGDYMLMGQIRLAQSIQSVDGETIKAPASEEDLIVILSAFDEEEYKQLMEEFQKTTAPNEAEAKN